MARFVCPDCDSEYICNQCGACQQCGLDVDSDEADDIEKENNKGGKLKWKKLKTQKFNNSLITRPKE